MPGTRRGCGASGTSAATPKVGVRSRPSGSSDEAVGVRGTADEVLWTMQSYFPNGEVTAEPYAGPTNIPLEPEPIFSREEGREEHEVVATYDAEFRAGFDRKITEWATDFMTRSKEAGKPFYMYLPYTQVHNPHRSPTRSTSGKTKRGNWGTSSPRCGRLHRDGARQARRARARGRHDRRLGLGTTALTPPTTPQRLTGSGGGPMARLPRGPWRGGLFTTLEGSNRTPCIVRWPGKVLAGGR